MKKFRKWLNRMLCARFGHKPVPMNNWPYSEFWMCERCDKTGLYLTWDSYL